MFLFDWSKRFVNGLFDNKRKNIKLWHWLQRITLQTFDEVTPPSVWTSWKINSLPLGWKLCVCLQLISLRVCVCACVRHLFCPPRPPPQWTHSGDRGCGQCQEVSPSLFSMHWPSKLTCSTLPKPYVYVCVCVYCSYCVSPGITGVDECSDAFQEAAAAAGAETVDGPMILSATVFQLLHTQIKTITHMYNSNKT